MELTTSDHDGIVVAEFSGALDEVSAAQVSAHLGELVPPLGRVLLDLTRTTRLSGAGLRLLLLLRRQARQQRARLVLSGVPDDLRRMLTHRDAFVVTDSVAAGVQVLNEGN
jgi:anti-sigma B factor antagonist